MTMKDLLTIACLTTAGSAFAQDAGVSAFSTPRTPGNAASVPTYTIVLDASAGMTAFPMPGNPRSFASHDELARFLATDLNAQPIYDAAGRVIGAEGYLVEIGDSYYLDAANNVQPITNPISAYIGGLAAKFSVAGVEYTVPSQAAPVPSHVKQCNTSGECLAESSWNTHWVGHIYDSVGTDVRQTSGGYQERTNFCWKWGFIPWICTARSGSNVLYLEGTLFSAGPVANKSIPLTAYPNTTRAKFGAWSVMFASAGGSVSTSASQLVGACGRGRSATVTASGATAAGSTIPYACFGGGVTCASTSETACNLSGVIYCANLSSASQFCGSCSNSCPSGWSCNNGACKAPPPPTDPVDPVCRAGTRDCGGTCVPTRYECP